MDSLSIRESLSIKDNWACPSFKGSQSQYSKIYDCGGSEILFLDVLTYPVFTFLVVNLSSHALTSCHAPFHIADRSSTLLQTNKQTSAKV